MIGTTIADRYQILELLGEGGMGRVYLAEHVRIGRKSAVKVMSPNLALSADAISRFNREAANAAKINHPNVAQIYDFGETESGMLYLAMEFVEGETLREMIDRDGAIPLARAAGLTTQIAAALAAAHHLDIVHRDLKPDNVMIAKHHDGTDWVKVVDFGIAKTVQGSGESGAGSQTVTTAGVSLGTPEYMSPEQLAGERLDNRTDLYSLGLVLFNMLTADLPYPRVTSKETLVRRLTARPRTLEDVAPWTDWPPALQAALDRALAPETADRYASVTDFARDVAAVAAQTPAPAPAQRATRLSGPTQRIAVPTPVATRKMAEPKQSRRTVYVVAGALISVIAVAGGALVAMRAGPKPEPIAETKVAPSVALQSAPMPKDTVVQTASTAAAAPAAPAPTPPVVQKAVVRPAQKNVAAAEPQPVVPDAKPDAKIVPAPRVTESPRLPAVPVAADSNGPAAGAADSARRAIADAATRRHGRIDNNFLSATGVEQRPLPTNASDSDRVRFLVQEIRGHFFRASQYLQQGDVPKTRGELRDMNGDVRTLRQLYPHAADSLRVQQQVAFNAVRLAQQVCPQAIADTSRHFPPNFRCEQLLPNAARGRLNGRGAGASPPPR